MNFHGATYSPTLDEARLSTQYRRVFVLMADEQWRTLADIQSVVGGSEAGISARLRDFRKEAFGGHTVERRRKCAGLWEYRLLPNTEAMQLEMWGCEP